MHERHGAYAQAYWDPRRGPRRPAFALYCVYGLFILYATLLPFQFDISPAALHAKQQWINWNPVVLVSGEATPLTDLVSNILLFLPLGMIGFHAQRRRSAGRAILRATGAGMLLSICVETLQFTTPSRNPATSDVLTNTFGTLLGTCVAALFQSQVERSLMRRLVDWRRSEPLLPILAGFALLVVLTSLVPFDFAPGVHYVKRAIRRAHLSPGSGPSWTSELQAILEYAILTGLAFRVVGRRRPGLAALRYAACIGGASLLALGLEVVQLTLRSRVASLRDIIAAIAGSIVGASIAAGLGDAGREGPEAGRPAGTEKWPRTLGWKLAGTAYVLVIVVRAAQPFDFHVDVSALLARLSTTALFPYYSYYYRANVAALASFLDGLLVYAPLAFVMARLRRERPPEIGSWSLGVGIAAFCAALAFGLEVLQLALPTRHPEVSDVLTAALGGGLGAFAWHWIASLVPGASVGGPQSAVALIPPLADGWARFGEVPVGVDPAPIARASS